MQPNDEGVPTSKCCGNLLYRREIRIQRELDETISKEKMLEGFLI